MTTDSPAAASPPSARGNGTVQPGIPAWRWLASLLVAGVAAWCVLHYTPLRMELPKEYLTINVMSPPDKQKELADKEAELDWKNCLIRFSLIGSCCGLVTLLATPASRLPRQTLSILGGLAVGILCGLVAGLFGIAVKHYLNPDAPWPMVTEENWPLVTDLIRYTLINVALALPLGWAWLLSRNENRAQEFVAILAAGILAGLLLPMVVSFLFPTIKTDVFPPTDSTFNGLWVGLLFGFIFLLTTFSRSRGAKSAVAHESRSA